MGGIVEAIEKGYPQREIAASAYAFQRQLEQGERVMVGREQSLRGRQGRPIPLLRIDEAVQKGKIEGLEKLKAARDGEGSRPRSRRCARRPRGRAT